MGFWKGYANVTITVPAIPKPAVCGDRLALRFYSAEMNWFHLRVKRELILQNVLLHKRHDSE
jgi:hypothetical protein